MKKIIACVLTLLLCVGFLSGCKVDPDKVNVTLINYKKDGIFYARSINAFAFFRQFREDDITVKFHEDKTFELNLFGERKSGTWREKEKSYIYGSRKGASFFEMKGDERYTGEGYSERQGGCNGMPGYLGFAYLGVECEFMEFRDGQTYGENYSLEKELTREAEILNDALSKKEADKAVEAENEESYYPSYCEYKYTKITKIGYDFYVTDGENQKKLNLACGFFYDFNGNEIEHADSIREGECIYKFRQYDDYYAIFYV